MNPGGADALAAALLDALDDDALDTLAERLAPRLEARLGRRPRAEVGAEHWMAPADAARYLGITRKRIYDLTSMRALEPDGRDGRTPLFRRGTLDAYVLRAA
jgi:hypothetical protein